MNCDNSMFGLGDGYIVESKGLVNNYLNLSYDQPKNAYNEY